MRNFLNKLSVPFMAALLGFMVAFTDPSGSLGSVLVDGGNQDQKGPRVLIDQARLTSIEIADMRLAAVAKDASGDYSATVETKQGANLLVKRGAHIGTRGGQVVQITPSRVIISEIKQDTLGKKSVRFSELAVKVSPATSGLTKIGRFAERMFALL